MEDFLVFVREERTGTRVADVDIGACGTGDAADLGFVVVELEDGVAFRADDVARLVVANGRMTSASTRHFGLGGVFGCLAKKQSWVDFNGGWVG